MADDKSDIATLNTASRPALPASLDGAHLLEMIGDVLDLAKLEAGKMDLVREVLDVGDVLQSAADVEKDIGPKLGGDTIQVIGSGQHLGHLVSIVSRALIFGVRYHDVKQHRPDSWRKILVLCHIK